MLSTNTKLKRVIFCESFFIFWKSAKCLRSSIKIIKTHMDEKWVMAVTTWFHIKLLATDYETRYHMAHHKNFIDQVMFIVIIVFIPKDNNLLGNDGSSNKFSFVLVGYYDA